MEVNDALLFLGRTGKWQFFTFVSLSTITMGTVCLNMTSIVFLNYRPAHHCTILNHSSIGDVNEPLLACSLRDASNHSVDCPNGWTFPNYTGSTIVTQWDLVCEREHLGHMSQFFLILGFMIGAIVFNYLADRIGRRLVLFLSSLLTGVVGSLSCLSGDIETFIATRFVIGLLLPGVMFAGYVLICESFPTHQRTFVGMICQVFWSFAICVMPLLSYLIEDWRYLQLTFSLFSFVTLPLFYFIRESVLWQLANDKIDEAEETLRFAARMNGVTFKEPILQKKVMSMTIEQTTLPTDNHSLKLREATERTNVDDEEGEEEEEHIPSVWHYFKNKKLFIYLVISSLMWAVNTLVYYGLVLSTAAMSGNRFVNAFLGGLVELLAFIVSYFALERLGRKKCLIFFQTLAGVSLCINAYLDREESGFQQSHPSLILLSSCIGRFGITASFTTVFLYVTELFPTNFRSTASGVSSLIGRIGNFLSVFAAYLAEKHAWVCMMVFGASSIIVALTVLVLPETLNRPLPRSIREATMGRSKKDKRIPRKNIVLNGKSNDRKEGSVLL